jgi:hypothetical protein
MHGGGAHTAGRLYSEQLLDELQIPLCRNWQQVETALEQGNLAFMPLQDWAPQLQRMIDLRNTSACARPFTPWPAFSTRWAHAAACKASSIPATKAYTAKPAACWVTTPS